MANLFMEKIENNLLNYLHKIYSQRFWHRVIDDIFFIWQHRPQGRLNEFLECLNNFSLQRLTWSHIFLLFTLMFIYNLDL